MVGVEPIDTTKPKIWRRKYLLLPAASKNNRGLSQNSVSLNSKNWGSFKLRVHAYS